MRQYFANKCSHNNALRFLSKPLATATGSRRYADALYRVNAVAERTPGAAQVPQRSAVLPARPNSPGKSWGGWEKLGRLLIVILFEPPLKTTPMPHPPVTLGQCRQPHHCCDQCHRVSFVSASISQVRASLASGVVGWSGLYTLSRRSLFLSSLLLSSLTRRRFHP